MRLVQHNLRPPVAVSPGTIFVSKYEWLMGWALQFTGHDRAAAEDLVQDTFVRFVLSQAERPEIEDADHAEPLLYRYLKYGHLTQLRNAARARIQPMHSSDFDSLQLSLQTSMGADPIRIQHDLRRIAAFLSWRKESAKAASVLILRFIHGYLPTEIMRIASITRRATDLSIAKAREEAKRYLDHPDQLRVMHLGTPPLVALRNVALPSELFIQEVKKIIFSSRSSPCLNEDQLLRHYGSSPSQPIDCELLAHLVSCEQCLDIVRTYNKMSSPPSVLDDSPFSQGPQKHPDRKKKEMTSLARDKNLKIAQVKLREVYEHRPRKLTIAVNGQVLATQNISSAVNKLEIEIQGNTSLEFVEILSDQGLCLLAMSVNGAPPEVPPQIQRQVYLSDDRELHACVAFNSRGSVLEVFYHDPLLLSEGLEEHNEVSESDAPFPALAVPVEPQTTRGIRFFVKHFLSILPLKRRTILNLVLATCSLGAIAVALQVIFLKYAGGHMPTTTLLSRATAADKQTIARTGAAIIRQELQFRTAQTTFTRVSYRDAKDHRRPKHDAINEERKQLQQKLTAAGVDWDDPLSAAGYTKWHDEQKVTKDAVTQTAEEFDLVTNISGGNVVEESLTIRKTDFHTIARTIVFRDVGTVEIAELEYDIVPWNRENDARFEPITGDTVWPQHRSTQTPSSRSPLPISLNESTLDEVELEVRLALTRLSAYTSERIQITRNSRGIEVKGIVSSAARKHEINSQLMLIPHVQSEIVSFDDLQNESLGEASPTVITQSTDTSLPSPLEQYLMSHGLDSNTAATLSQRLLNSAHSVNRHSTAILELCNRFYIGHSLTPDARIALDHLLADQKMKLLIALQEEQRQLQDTGIPIPVSESVERASIQDLSIAGNRQLALCIALTVGKSQQDESPQEIVRTLSRLLNTLQQAAISIPANSSNTTSSNSVVPTNTAPQE